MVHLAPSLLPQPAPTRSSRTRLRPLHGTRGCAATGSPTPTSAGGGTGWHTASYLPQERRQHHYGGILVIVDVCRAPRGRGSPHSVRSAPSSARCSCGNGAATGGERWVTSARDPEGGPTERLSTKPCGTCGPTASNRGERNHRQGEFRGKSCDMQSPIDYENGAADRAA
jgi:hypothetical protein